MQIQLICNGMMIFWYRPPGGGMPDGYRILIPQAPVDSMGMKMHELRLSATRGGLPSVLSYPNAPQATQYFQLQFGSGPSIKARGPKPPQSSVGLYSRGGVVASPNYGDTAQNSGVAFVIDIPYPDQEDAARFDTYGTFPYDHKGHTVHDFSIYPNRVPRCNVFSFTVADSTQPVILTNEQNAGDRRVLVPGPLAGDVKLYLYSESAVAPTGMHHLGTFNKMVRYQTDSTSYPALDLALNVNSGRKCALLSTMTSPTGDLMDLQTLCEINGSADMCNLPVDGIDPAECAQGPGC